MQADEREEASQLAELQMHPKGLGFREQGCKYASHETLNLEAYTRLHPTYNIL